MGLIPNIASRADGENIETREEIGIDVPSAAAQVWLSDLMVRREEVVLVGGHTAVASRPLQPGIYVVRMRLKDGRWMFRKFYLT